VAGLIASVAIHETTSLDQWVKVGQCFPGGHASAGFTLVAFGFLPR